ncbi:UDP-4-amino-4,6-dideoxy-N-acetyl-beta-L-altrosamine N-acetyltransferase [Thiohalospira halophila DSM 15071]|uniref:UDP-4-amino-4,6-dideoxy-N-acetyl-beta-L-altrosamine N-acetyltransferase n=1 Tax=Thiohalospira halophila DSM 15071 TaxID=1123397 RepID=A0A1I1NFM3_9GAMM|nr:UDP-4-amino-4,6-dideoxy-N-acetyl-beta-L-altrosamine N-acetyltransferase [Thiohalospira halophila]SFC96285.1 UDP-4-amino-4,6-dideoxy-N-acetyl-beta-L-altrosamine N-acetyltransferase [Thiohalospira halophila DSM 15071]
MLEPLTEATRDLILPWRNAPEVRRQMYTRHEIPLEEHRAWFERMQADPTRCWYLCRDASDDPAGVVYFTDIEPEGGSAFWGFYARPDAPAGIGMRMEYSALDHAFHELGLHKLNCEVLATNTAVVNLHKKCGFTREGTFREQHFDGEQYVDIIRLGLLAREWPKHRERLHERIAQLDALAARKAEGDTPPRRIAVLSDANSWINEHLLELVEDWEELGHTVHWTHEPADAEEADFCFCLGFGRLLPETVRARFRHTLVVHESDLPRGKGWSPLTWQILDGEDRIPVTLIEAAEKVDSGTIYAQRWVEFEGHELVDELRTAQAEATRALCREFVDDYPVSAERGREQHGEESFYPRRGPEDSRLDPERSLAEQFNLLRVVDNERYPAFFEWRGRRFQLHIIGTRDT